MTRRPNGDGISVDSQRATELVAPDLEIVKAHLAVVEGGVKISELGEDRSLVDIVRRCLVVGGPLCGPGCSSLALGSRLGLLLAIALQLAKGRTPPCHVLR